MKGHELKIHSLGDVDASCSCGGWSLIGTGERTIEHVRNVWEFHVKQQLAHVETVYGDKLFVSRADLDGTRTYLPLFFSTGRAYEYC